MAITAGYFLLDMIKDRDQRALNIDLAWEPMQKQSCLNGRKSGEQVANWKKNNG